MEDNQIIKLYQERSETAISETANKYGVYCHSIAYRILHNEEDSEECVNDTYFRTWNSIPPQNPNVFSVFLGKITRNLALDKYRYYNREKRGNGQTVVVLEELEHCIPSRKSTEQEIDDKMLVELLNTFLENLPVKKRTIFVQRYWYLRSISEIAQEFHVSESNIKITLFRIRNKLKNVLEKEGIVL